MKNNLDAWFRQAAFNVFRGMKILPKAVGINTESEAGEVCLASVTMAMADSMRFRMAKWLTQTVRFTQNFSRNR